jgi:RNA polymerase-binding transcription factor DksA
VNQDDLRKRLEEERSRLQKLQAELSDDHDGGEAASELSTVDQHPADAGSELFEREKDIAIVQSFEEQEAQIESALERLGSDDFGKCEVCGKQIDDARLEAIPWTRNCVEHQAEMDRAG